MISRLRLETSCLLTSFESLITLMQTSKLQQCQFEYSPNFFHLENQPSWEEKVPQRSELRIILKSTTPELVYENLIRCKVNQKYPNLDVLQFLAEFFSLRKHFDGLEAVKNICRITAAQDFQRLSCFSHYTAQLHWSEGNITKAMVEFLEASKKNEELKIDISYMIKNLISQTVPNAAKASVNMIQNAAIEYSLSNDDYSVLFVFWYSLFTSQWDHDHSKSLSLLSEHKELRHFLKTQITQVSKKFLINQNIVAYQRLLESVLHCNMVTCSEQLLRALFDYYYKAGYYQGCRAVVKCCEEINVVLTRDQLYKYDLLNGASKPQMNYISSIVQRSKIKYKF